MCFSLHFVQLVPRFRCVQLLFTCILLTICTSNINVHNYNMKLYLVHMQRVWVLTLVAYETRKAIFFEPGTKYSNNLQWISYTLTRSICTKGLRYILILHQPSPFGPHWPGMYNSKLDINDNCSCFLRYYCKCLLY